MASRLDSLVFEDAKVVFRNFAGNEKQFNSAGDRNFCILLDPKKAAEMKKDGWNVKQLKPREEGDEPQDYIQVSVSYGKGRPPQVTLLTNGGTKRIDLGADQVMMLDFADVENWDIILNPYEWEVNGNTGVKAYLKKAFVTLNEDELDRKYAGVEEAHPMNLLNSTVTEEVS